MWILVIILLITGCTSDLIIRKGKVADGIYLVTWRATNSVAIRCGEFNAAACVKPHTQTIPGGIVRTVEIIVPFSALHFHDIVAHEVCHAVASSQGLLPDPCHFEDDGIIPKRIER